MAEKFTTTKETLAARIYRLRWWTLITISISVLVCILDMTVMNVALPTIQKQLGATSSQLLWMVNVYTMLSGSLMITSGGLGDRIGRGKMLTAGLVVFGLASLGAAFSGNPTQLIFCRVFMGAAEAMIMPSTLSTITNVFPEKERGQAIGVWAGLNALGVAMGPIVGGLMLSHFSWNSIFWINIPVVIIALTLGRFFVPDTRDSVPHKLDIIGNLLSLAGLASLIYGLINGGSRGWTDTLVLGALIGSLVIISLFILWERRVKEPLLDLRFFGNARFSTGIAILIIMGLALNGVMYVLTYYLQIIHGYTPLSAGLRFIPAAFGMLLGAISADKLVLRFGQKAVMTAGFIGTAAVLFVFSMLKVDSSFWLLGTEEAFFGVFLGFVVAPVTNIIMSNLPKEKTGLGSAINSSFRQIAGTLGVAVLGGILGSVYSSHFLKAAVNINSLPAVLVQKASDSVGVAMGIVRSGQLHGALADKLSLAAKDSFMDGWRVIMLICSCIFIVGAVIVLKFVPSRKEINTDDIGSKEHLEHHAGL